MMTQAMTERISLLIKQGRFKEAQSLIETHLSQYPDDAFGRYCYALVLFQGGDPDKSRLIVGQLLAEEPENENILKLSIEIDIDGDRFDKAESKAELLLELSPGASDAYLTMARIKMAQRSYDKALTAVNKSLELDAENLEALNLKIMVDGLLGNKSTKESIKNALELDAENPSSIANHGMELLRKGNVKEVLDRFKYALSIDPNNMLAQYGMQEALKSAFRPYRWFSKYREFSTRLSAKGSWKLIIGSYIGYRILNRIAANNPELAPFLMPVIYLILTFFLLTWIMEPLMNIYLLNNKYGKVLLDKNEKTMAQLCGISLVFTIISLLLYLSDISGVAIVMAAIFGVLLIPLGSFLKPSKPKNRKFTTIYTIVLVLFGIWGGFYGGSLFVFFLIGMFIYQWVINGILIKENARVFE